MRQDHRGRERRMTAQASRWTADHARAWYDAQPWLVGCNYTPAYAINQLETWQPPTFDIDAIARELDLAASIGFNTLRVFLHDLCHATDAKGFVSRIDAFLDVAFARGIRTMPVFFDSVWHPYPRAGAQRPPEPHVHNSGWVQSPGVHVLREPGRFDLLEPYVTDLVVHFRDDPRILAWDLWNEPDNNNVVAYGNRDIVSGKGELVHPLLEQTFRWARAARPTQPLTAGVWGPIFDAGATPTALQQMQFDASDVISFHTYAPRDVIERGIAMLAQYDRPLLCTEYMARGNNCLFEDALPVFKKHRIAAYNWGFVAGRSQTQYPWDSWARKYEREPEVWFHDLFRADHTPYRPKEIELIRSLTRPAAELEAWVAPRRTSAAAR